MPGSLSESEKRLIKTLHERELFIEQIANNTPDIIYVLDLKKGRLSYSNKRLKEIMGAENIMLDKIHPLDYRLRANQIQACVFLGKSEALEVDVRLKVKNGHWRWFNICDVAFKFGPDGLATHTVGVVRDIHESKMRDDVLSHKDQMLSQVLNLQSVSIVAYKAVRNKQGDILDYEFILMSRAFEEFHQRTDLLGKWLFEEFPETKALEYERWARIVETGQGTSALMPFASPKTGKTHWFSLKYEKFGDGLIILWDDVTEKRDSVEKIKEQAAFINRITQTTPDIISVFDYALGKHIFVNHEVNDLLGISPETVKHSDPAELRKSVIHPDDWEAIRGFTESIKDAADGEILETVCRMRHTSGRWLHFNCRGTVFQRNESGQVTQCLSIIRDITRKREALEKKNEATKLLESVFEVSLFNIAVTKSIRDKEGKITDFEYLMVNRPQGPLAKGQEGARISEVYPGIRSQGIFDRLLQVVETGKPDEWPQQYSCDGYSGWFFIKVVKFNDGYVSTTIDLSSVLHTEGSRAPGFGIMAMR